MNFSIRALLVIVAVVGVSCTADSRQDEKITPPIDIPLCTENFVAGLIVEVRDGLTGQPAAYGAHGEIRDGAYVETLWVENVAEDPQAALRMIGAWERPGIYSVIVQKEGYRDWSGTATVEADVCHVLTVTLQAMLESQG